MKPLTDNDPMPWKGDHHGKPMKDIPHSWFIWMHDKKMLHGAVKDYAEANVPQLKTLKENRERK